MINENKVRLMTKAAVFEKHEGKKALSANRMFRGDYIGIHLIGAWFCYTIAFALCLALWAFYKVEYFMENINQIDFVSMGKGLGTLYVSILGIYLVINYIVFHLRYRKYREGLARYNHILKRLSHMYGVDSKKTAAKAGGDAEDEDIT